MLKLGKAESQTLSDWRMTDDDKPVMELDVTDIDSIWIPPNVQGDVLIVFCAAQEHDISLKQPPAILAKLELAREEQAEMAYLIVVIS
jgi:hypothetical protein